MKILGILLYFCILALLQLARGLESTTCKIWVPISPKKQEFGDDHMKGFLSRQKPLQTKTDSGPRENLQRKSQTKTSGAGPGFSEKVTKESQTKFQNFQVFKISKNTCHLFIFYFARRIPRKNCFWQWNRFLIFWKSLAGQKSGDLRSLELIFAFPRNRFFV